MAIQCRRYTARTRLGVRTPRIGDKRHHDSRDPSMSAGATACPRLSPRQRPLQALVEQKIVVQDTIDIRSITESFPPVRSHPFAPHTPSHSPGPPTHFLAFKSDVRQEARMLCSTSTLSRVSFGSSCGTPRPAQRTTSARSRITTTTAGVP